MDSFSCVTLKSGSIPALPFSFLCSPPSTTPLTSYTKAIRASLGKVPVNQPTPSPPCSLFWQMWWVSFPCVQFPCLALLFVQEPKLGILCVPWGQQVFGSEASLPDEVTQEWLVNFLRGTGSSLHPSHSVGALCAGNGPKTQRTRLVPSLLWGLLDQLGAVGIL